MAEGTAVTRIVKYLVGFGGIVGSLTAILYGAGFLVMRSHYTMLGVWTDIPLVKESYLYEGGLFFVYSIYHFTFILPFLFVLLGVVYGAKHILSLVLRVFQKSIPSVAPKPKEQQTQAEDKGSGMPAKIQRAFVLMLAILMFPRLYSQALSIRDMLFVDQSVIGNFSRMTVDNWLQQSLLIDSYSELNEFYGWLVAGTLIMGLFAWQRQREEVGFFYRALQGILQSIFVFQLLLLPMNYGILIKPPIYPKAYINIRDSGSTPAWLLFQNSGDLVVFRHHSSEREIVTIKKSSIDELRIIGRENILNMQAKGENSL